MSGFNFSLYCKRDKSQEITSSKEKTITNHGLKHGDMIYLWPFASVGQGQEEKCTDLTPKNGVSSSVNVSQPTSIIPGSKIPVRSNIEEDKVDLILQKMDGTIRRKRDPKK